MKIATWNVNSIKQRLDHVKKWVVENDIDVLFLQELKSMEFPTNEFTAVGYHSDFVPQKGFNGVATLSKTKFHTHHRRLIGDDADEQSRYLEIELNGIRLINIYLPNGNPKDTEKFPYKLKWMDRLHARAKELREARIPFLIGGDFNVIPEPEDVYDPAAWEGDALFSPEARRKFRMLESLGLTDAFRIGNQDAHQYTFWDYTGGSWQQDKGIRIDHFLLSPPITDRFIACRIDKAPRDWEKPSDHTPVALEIM